MAKFYDNPASAGDHFGGRTAEGGRANAPSVQEQVISTGYRQPDVNLPGAVTRVTQPQAPRGCSDCGPTREMPGAFAPGGGSDIGRSIDALLAGNFSGVCWPCVIIITFGIYILTRK